MLAHESEMSFLDMCIGGPGRMARELLRVGLADALCAQRLDGLRAVIRGKELRNQLLSICGCWCRL